MKLSDVEIKDLIARLNKKEDIPEDYKYKLFPTIHKEYELVYAGKMRKEDILANEDGVFPVPLQVDKLFNGNRDTWEDGWKNMIVFGDNLQFLKTVNENKDPLIKDKIKGKIKLIYIDPPFGTGDEYEGNKGQKGYSAKTKGAEFVEFVRRRLIIAKEILSFDGNILVRQGHHFGHYIKSVLDEVFGKDQFRNELIVNRIKKADSKAKKFNVAVDTIYWYSKSDAYYFRPYYKSLIKSKKGRWHAMDSQGPGGPAVILGKLRTPPNGRHWTYEQDTIYELERNGRIKLSKTGTPQYFIDPTDTGLVDSNWTDIPGYSTSTGYPTENSEQLLERILKSFTISEDIVMDFFGGSGTTASVAEKLNCKWIVCDIGKLSFYTIQKRILNIKSSKSLDDLKKKYNKEAKSFLTVNTGHYSLEKVFQLIKEEYKKFVMSLFEVDAIKKTINGIKIDGQKKDGFFSLIWPYWEFPDSTVNEVYLNELHNHIGKKVGNRFYIIAPASYVDFISDYLLIGNVKYYFLKVPYHLIKELHNVHFKKTRQPQSKKNVNDLDDAIGFHFMMKPEVESEISITDGMVTITINKFLSSYFEEETDRILENYESLAMVLIDKRFNGSEFDLDTYYFAEDLLPKKKKSKELEENNDQTEINIQEELKQVNKITIPPFSLKECGKTICIIYIDIYGNEFIEERSIDHSSRR